jgi:hypothetical protein
VLIPTALTLALFVTKINSRQHETIIQIQRKKECIQMKCQYPVNNLFNVFKPADDEEMIVFFFLKY